MPITSLPAPTPTSGWAMRGALAATLLIASLLSARGAELNPPARPADEPGATANSPAAKAAGNDRVISILFGLGGADISAQGQALIREIGELLKANIHLNVLLVGHTPNLGSPEYCVAVAKKMTAAVAAELSKLDPRPGRILELPLGNQETSDYLCISEACRRPAATGSVEIRVSQ